MYVQENAILGGCFFLLLVLLSVKGNICVISMSSMLKYSG